MTAVVPSDASQAADGARGGGEQEQRVLTGRVFPVSRRIEDLAGRGRGRDADHERGLRHRQATHVPPIQRHLVGAEVGHPDRGGQAGGHAPRIDQVRVEQLGAAGDVRDQVGLYIAVRGSRGGAVGRRRQGLSEGHRSSRQECHPDRQAWCSEHRGPSSARHWRITVIPFSVSNKSPGVATRPIRARGHLADSLFTLGFVH